MEQANAANEALDYLKVIELYQQAQGIAYDERVAGLIKETKNKLESAYQQLIDSGNSMANAGYFDRARESYEKALRLKPGDVLAKLKLKKLK